MGISIYELLAVARESEGVKAVKGDAMLCENGLHRLPDIWWSFCCWNRASSSETKESIIVIF